MMKRLFTMMALVLTATATWAAGPGADTLTVRIKGMRCEECAHKVQGVLRQEAGVSGIAFDLEKRTAAIEYDPALVSPDTLRARLAATGRYKPTAYDPADVILRGMGLQMADMFCQRCADRITTRLQQLPGIDSLAPHLDKHYLFVRYDANKTCKADIRQALTALGFTPVSYYTSANISFAYFNIPAEEATEATVEQALAIEGVDDANVSARRGSLAITYVNTDLSAESLLQQLTAAGIHAVVPPPHECREKQQSPTAPSL